MLPKAFKPYEKKYWVLIFLVATYLFINTAWVSEDAFITFRVVDNLLAGHGPVYNLGERVQVYTHPLWFFLLVAGRALGLDLYYFSLGLSYVIFIASLGLFLALAQRRQVPLPLVLALLLLASLSRAFIDYASSGLENSLLTLEYLLFIGLLGSEALPRRRKYFGALLLYGLAFLTRPDGIVLLTPALLPLLIQTVRGEKGWLSLGFLALYPVILWEVFSLFYYGSPTPNTALAKLNIGFPREVLIHNGLSYLLINYRFDVITSSAIYLGLLLGLGRRDTRLLAAGLLLYLVYVVLIGADYMMGRFLSAPFLVALLLLALALKPLPLDKLLHRPRGQVMLLAGGLLAYLSAWLLLSPTATPNPFVNPLFLLTLLLLALALGPVPLGAWQPPLVLMLLAVDLAGGSANYRWSGEKRYRVEAPKFFDAQMGISDERAWYLESTNLLTVLLEQGGNYLNHDRLKDYSAVNDHIFLSCDIGLFGYQLSRSNHIIDPMALADPFLARLPARNYKYRIGHYERALPPGYVVSLRKGRNVLVSPKLRQLYADVLLVSRGPLLSGERFAAIWRLNSGHYKNLDQEFDRNDINLHEVGITSRKISLISCMGYEHRVYFKKPTPRKSP